MSLNIINKIKSKIKLISNKKVGQRWNELNNKRAQISKKKSRWWQFNQINNHINARVFSNMPNKSGFISAAIHKHHILPCDRAVSIGCGNAQKEIELLKLNLVQHFDLYELSAARITAAIKRATKLGLQDRLKFINEDVFETAWNTETYDLVYWNNSLHHMLDVPTAVRWSHAVLKIGGGVMVDDFIGPSRFQWSKKQLMLATKIRQCFAGTHYLVDPKKPNKNLSIKVSKPSKLAMYREDPSEAADSTKIIDQILLFFPLADIIYTGGVAYHLALNDMLANFDETRDSHILELLLLIDDLIIEQGESHYAVAYAKKS